MRKVSICSHLYESNDEKACRAANDYFNILHKNENWCKLRASLYVYAPIKTRIEEIFQNDVIQQSIKRYSAT